MDEALRHQFDHVPSRDNFSPLLLVLDTTARPVVNKWQWIQLRLCNSWWFDC